MKRILKAVMLQCLPTRGHRWLRARKRAAASCDHRDSVSIDVNPQVVFETYWKDVEAGKGPALIVWLDYRKIVKFDCLGEGRGHYHIGLRSEFRAPVDCGRIYLSERTVEEQIDRVVFELKTNLRYYIRNSHYGHARKAIVTDAELFSAIQRARESLLRHHDSALGHTGTVASRSVASGSRVRSAMAAA